MIEALLATLLPLGFLIVLFGGGAHFLRNNIEQDGKAPIHRTLFYLSKYSILAIWGAMVLQIWGINLSVIAVPHLMEVIGLAAWFFGFAFLYLGRFEMGSSFRLGTPNEHTTLKVGGLFSLSRNPMYVGVCVRSLNALPEEGGLFSRRASDPLPAVRSLTEGRTA